MSYRVDFKNVSEIGLGTSPVSKALAGLRANEARYFKDKYNQDFIVQPISQSRNALNCVFENISSDYQTKNETDLFISNIFFISDLQPKS